MTSDAGFDDGTMLNDPSLCPPPPPPVDTNDPCDPTSAAYDPNSCGVAVAGNKGEKQMTSDAGFLEKFFKIWTIINTVWEITDNFLKAGGASVNPLIVANEASKEIQRKVAAGFLPQSVLDGHQQIIQGALIYHPAIQNVPQPDDSVAAVLD